MRVYTLTTKGKEYITLKEPAMSEGGEGYIYELSGSKNGVVKIYKNHSDAKKREEKLKAMIKIANTQSFAVSGLARNIAWPLDPVFNMNNEFIGYGMYKMNCKYSLAEIYSYPPKKNASISIEDRIYILISLCNLIDALHKQGQVFGDFNPQNIRISSDFEVKFMDADSFAIDAGRKQYKCIVCAPGYVAPELIRKVRGKKYEDLSFRDSFTKETDYFGLAVHAFYMLFRADPFVSRKIVQQSLKAIGTKEDIVEKGLSPFFIKLPNRDIPIYAIPTNAFPNYIVKLFERGLLTKDPHDRPTPTEWIKALKKFKEELVQCDDNPTHNYWKNNYECPYCNADKSFADFNTRLTRRDTGYIKTTSNSNGSVTPGGVTSSNGNSKKKKMRPTYNSGANTFFWLFTLLLGAAMQLTAYKYLYPMLCEFAFDSSTDTLSIIAMIVVAVVGMIGTIVYNACWTPIPTLKGHHRWYEYILSVLCNAGFSVGIVLAVVVLVFGIAIVVVIAIFAIIIALISGG